MSLINDALKRAKQAQGQKPAEKPIGVSLEPVHRAGGLGGLPVWVIPIAIVLCLILASAFIYFGWRSSKNSKTISVQAASGQPQIQKPVVPTVQPTASSASAPTQPAETTVQRSAPAPSVVSKAAPTNPPALRVQVNTNLVTRTTVVALAQVPVVAEPSRTVAPVSKEQSSISTQAVQAPRTESPAAARPPAVRVETQVPTAPLNSGTVAPAAATTDGEAVAPASEVPVAEPIAWPNLKIQGIFLRMTKSSAVVNGRTVFVGDTVEGARVVRIERQSLTFDFKGTRRTVYLP